MESIYSADAIAQFWAYVKPDPETGCLLWQPAPMKVGYGRVSVDGRRRYAHRVAWEIENGPIPPRALIDHLCHVKICVNVKHMRLATRKENAENLSGLTSMNTSGYRGVTFCKQTKRWRAQIMHHKKMVNIGRFDTIEEAAAAAAAKRAELFTPIPAIEARYEELHRRLEPPGEH